MRKEKLNGLRTQGVFSVLVVACLVACMSVSLSSCSQDDIVAPTPSVESSDGNSDSLSLRAGSTEYCYVALTYKNAYKHLRQTTGECSWTSYVLTAAAVARGSGSNYPSNQTNPTATDYRNKITHARTVCVDTAYIWKLQWYAQNTDHPAYSTISTQLVPYDDLDAAVFGFLAKRRTNQKPCIFLGKKGGEGHFYILWDLEWNGTAASSYVYYTDPDTGSPTVLSSYDDRKNYMSLQNMISSNMAVKYNFIFF